MENRGPQDAGLSFFCDDTALMAMMMMMMMMILMAMMLLMSSSDKACQGLQFHTRPLEI